MVNWRLLAIHALAIAALPATASAQPADLPIPAATTTEYPDGIAVGETGAGPVYVDAKGRTLYGLDMRVLQRWSPDPAFYCESGCEGWEPVPAPEGSEPNIVYPKGFGPGRREQMAKMAELGYHADPQKAPDWTIIEGAHGLQWVYKGWHMVYVRKDGQPGSTEHDGAEELKWNTLKFIPPVPEVIAPAQVEPLFVEGGYALSYGGEKLLYSGKCKTDCAGWEPLAAGLASRGLGDWKVSRAGDVPQWTYRGKPVFVAPSDDAGRLPEAGRILRP